MEKIDKAVFAITHLEDLSYLDTPIHRLDPRAKVITTFLFLIAVVSFDKYTVSALIPFLIYPVVLMSIGNIPLQSLVKKIVLVAPFAVFIGIFNPLLDRDIMITFGHVGISGGWVSFTSIMIRFFLTVGAALVLIAVTGFNAVCMALEKLGTPQIFVIQLMFIYRYLFVLVDEAIRLNRARALRTFNKRGTGIKVFGHMIGHLLLRTLDRAQRIHLAMNCRGFDGQIKTINRLKMSISEVLFIIAWSLLFIVMRLYNIPNLIGTFMMEYFV